MRCFPLLPPARCARSRCAVPPALAPSCTVAQCVEISMLTHQLSHMSTYPALANNLAPPVCAYLMRCFSPSITLRCTRSQCAVAPPLAPSCIVAQCAEISHLTHLRSHMSKHSSSADNLLRRLLVLAIYDVPVCRPHLAVLVTNAQCPQHSHPRALPLNALRYPISRTCVVTCPSTLHLQTFFGATCMRMSNAIHLFFAYTSLLA